MRDRGSETKEGTFYPNKVLFRDLYMRYSPSSTVSVVNVKGRGRVVRS